MFFQRRTRPLRLSAARLRALRLSLNTPVVATQELPVGPARGAIVMHVEPGHGTQITVGVRTLACGSVALYGLEGEIDADTMNEALDGALSFAEGMGFLFDDDLLAGGESAREKALLLWKEAIGDAAGEGAAPAPLADAEAALFELEGGDLTNPGISPPMPHTDLELERIEDVLPEARAREAEAAELLEFQPSSADSSPSLSKFRMRADAPAEEASEPAPRARQPLGRVRLVERGPERGPEARRSFRLRLLSSF